MNILKWFKFKKKQKENKKINPNENFKFEMDYYNEDIIEGFKFIYCNNYTDRLYNEYNKELSFISCKITLKTKEKTLRDIINFINVYCDKKIYKDSQNNYKDMYLYTTDKNAYLYLRGNICFYEKLCENIHNNIITRYIRNNIFPNGEYIPTPNEYLNNIYNSITNPCKDIDILFIEDNIECKNFDTVVGISLKKDKGLSIFNKNKILYYYKNLLINDRYVVYLEVNRLSDEELEYITNNVEHGNKLLNILHKYIENNNINSDTFNYDVDEII